MHLRGVEDPLIVGSYSNWASFSLSNFSGLLVWLDDGEVFIFPVSAPEINFANFTFKIKNYYINSGIIHIICTYFSLSIQ